MTAESQTDSAVNVGTSHMALTAVGRVANGPKGKPAFIYAARCSCGFAGDGITYDKEADAIEALRLLHLPRRPFLTEDVTRWVDEFVAAAQ